MSLMSVSTTEFATGRPAARWKSASSAVGTRVARCWATYGMASTAVCARLNPTTVAVTAAIAVMPLRPSRARSVSLPWAARQSWTAPIPAPAARTASATSFASVDSSGKFARTPT